MASNIPIVIPVVGKENEKKIPSNKFRGPKSNDSIVWETRAGLQLPKESLPDEGGFEITEARLSLPDRYSKLTHIIFEEGIIPVSYCYYETSDAKSLAQYFGVEIIQSYHFDTTMFEGCNIRWMDLKKEGKANLHRLLLMPFRLWEVVRYNAVQRKWEHRNDHPREEIFSLLSVYGKDTESPNVMAHLRRDLDPRDMEPLFDNYLLHLWTTAMNNGMTNGLGRTAVYDLLRKLADLLPLVNVNEAVIICNITSCLRGDDIKISDETSSSLLSSPPIKRKKTHHEGGDTNEHEERNNEDKWPAHHRHFVDLKVICRDRKSGFTKYLIMVEIHSRGKILSIAQKKFMKEIIAALQAQNSVFGILFSYDSAVLYFARKSLTGEVRINKFKYDLVQLTEPMEAYLLNVAAFQALIMDIFTCLLYGIEKIEN